MGLPISTWQKAGRLVVVKAASHRIVWRADLLNATLFIKYYPIPDWRAWIRQCFRPTKARTEAITALRLQACGIRTVTPIAFGEAGDGSSCLVTLGLRSSATVRELLEGPQANRFAPHQRHRLTAELADLIALMHRQGILHGDLHAGNLLLAEGEDGQCHIHVIDLHAVRFANRLRPQQAWNNLIMLNRWFIQRSSRTDRLRFWRRYVARCAGSPLAPADPKRAARRLEHETWQSCLRFWRKRDRRCVSENAYFQQIRLGRCVGFAVRDLARELIRELAANPDAPFADSGQVLKHSRSSAVVVLERTCAGRRVLLIWKRFSVTRWSDPWVHLVRPSPALRSWVNGHRLRECGLPTPRPLMVLHRRRFGLVGESYLLTEFVENATDLRRAWDALKTPRERRRAIEATARLIGDMHRRCLSHRDLKAANLLANPEGTLNLIDLVGMERLRNLSRRRKVQNLARLHLSFCLNGGLSLSERLRFLWAYLRNGGDDCREWKSWWREIAAATVKKIEQNRRRGRPLS
jgi:tRNA A-37 threonylcarbamoyl transferase component Bud32